MADPNGLAGVPEPAHAPLQPGASAAPMPQPPLQGMMQVHQGMQYGTPAASMYQPQQYMPIPQHQQNEQLRQFWIQQHREVQEVGTDPAEFKNHQLPLARIKKIMKSDEDVRMISAEAPVLFAKACEMFILELTLRSWNHSEENKRRTLQRNDIAAAITRTDIFDFLVDIVPREERDETLRPGGSLPSMPMPGSMGYWPGQPGPSMHPGGEPGQAMPPLSGQAQTMQQPQQFPQVMPMGARPPGMQMDPSMLQAYYMQQPHHGGQPQQQQDPQQQPSLQQGQWQHLSQQPRPMHMPGFDGTSPDGQTNGQ